MMEIVKKSSAEMMETLVNEIEVLEDSNSQLRKSMIALSCVEKMSRDHEFDLPETRIT